MRGCGAGVTCWTCVEPSAATTVVSRSVLHGSGECPGRQSHATCPVEAEEVVVTDGVSDAEDATGCGPDDDEHAANRTPSTSTTARGKPASSRRWGHDRLIAAEASASVVRRRSADGVGRAGPADSSGAVTLLRK